MRARRCRRPPARTTGILRASPALRAVGLGLTIGLAALGPAGCARTGTQAERSGEAMRRDLPEELARLLPADVIECHRESATAPAPYTLRIFRRPGGTWLEFPKKLPGLERHDLPARVLEGLLAAKVPGLDAGRPRSGVSRFTHWSRGNVEYQVREIVTDLGWFASVEQFGR